MFDCHLIITMNQKMSHCYNDLPVCIQMGIFEIKTEHL